jgi:hypothetical protein
VRPTRTPTEAAFLNRAATLAALAFCACALAADLPASAQASPQPEAAARLATPAPQSSPGASPLAPAPTGASPAPAPSPSASPAASPAPTASPRPLGWRLGGRFEGTFVDQHTAGPGQSPPEAYDFERGSPLAPNTPYDLLSSAPQVPGVAGIGELFSTIAYGTRAFDISADLAAGYVDGSITNAAYWGENLVPTLNPHVGSQALPYAIAFPTHPGQDDGSVFRLSVLGGTIATADGNLHLRGGWFDLAQTDRFVFAQPALTSVNPAIAYAPAESLASAPISAAFWQPDSSALPLHGIDVVGRGGDAQVELTDAALPSLPGESAILRMASLVVDDGNGTRLSAQVLHATTSGALFETTLPYGIDPNFLVSPQGVLPTSFLSGQRQTLAGLRGAFHIEPKWGLDGVVEIGRSWYDANPVIRPGTEAPGGFYHAGVAEKRGRVTATFDEYRMEPRYAPMILPYGVAENQWSAAFAWPGQWLKSNYQLIDNSILGINRQGYKVGYALDGGPVEIHAAYTDLRQIDPETTLTSTQAGFVDGFYLPQSPDAATLGRQKRYALWTAWHPAFADVTLDVVDDTLYRPFDTGHVIDGVSYEVPQAVLTLSRKLSENVTAAAGIGRYAMKGAFAEPIDFAQRLYFAGAQVRESARESLSLTFRRTIFDGITTFPPAKSGPNYTGSAIIVEQRITL